MKKLKRREFISASTRASAGILVAGPVLGSVMERRSTDDQINVAVIGIRSRGKAHIEALARFQNVKIAVLCDIDQRLLAQAVSEVEALTGYRPAAETEYRNVLENQDIHAVSIATPNHWHALQTIWACQAGKDVYVEKPVSHTVLEGRKMVEAARKYKRIVQTGTQSRSNPSSVAALDFIRSGGLGDIYMAKGLCLKPRAGIGHTPDSTVPEGVDWDTFLGPAPYRAFNENRFHYKWHWFWDTGNGDLGNQGIHQTDIARWALNQTTHPVRIQGMGNYFVWDSDQETPNIQHLEFEYADGRILQFDVRGLATNSDGGMKIGNLIYGSKGWMSIDSEDSGTSKVSMADITMRPDGFSSYAETPGPVFSNEEPETADAVYNHFRNFIDCIRTRNTGNLHADILEGHLSTSLCHLGNIATRLKRTLYFDPVSEKFINDPEADRMLTKNYRAPYLLPDKV